MQARKTLGPYSRCHHYASRSCYVNCCLGSDAEWLGHFLRLEFVCVWLNKNLFSQNANTATVIYGVGVGGEYPMTATSGMENAVGSGKISTKEDRLHRGRKVTSAFLMQGWGQFFNQALLLILLLIFHHGRLVFTRASSWIFTLTPQQWQSSIFHRVCSVDLPHFFRHPRDWNPLVGLLPYVQDEGCE